MRILVLSNSARGEWNFRRERFQAYLEEGHEVVVVCPPHERVEDLVKLGCRYIPSQLNQYSKNPWREARVFVEYLALLKTAEPDLVLTYTIKPNIWGGLAAQVRRVPYIANVTGLGRALKRGGFATTLSMAMYRAALRSASYVNFENAGDARFFEDRGIALGRTRVTAGSGVNLDRFPCLPYPPDSGTFELLYVGRLQAAKGIPELLAAMRQLGNLEGRVHLTLVGPPTEDFTREVNALGSQVTVVGDVKDVRPYLLSAHALILPSHHEGLSNVLLEAAASCRPIITSNIDGCRETFDEGVSGFGHAPQNSDEIASAIRRMAALPHDSRQAMGRAGRKKVSSEFSRVHVTEQHLRQLERAPTDATRG